MYNKKRDGYIAVSERVEKVDTLLDGNAVRSKIRDFRTALYPRQYHPSALEKPLIQRFFAYKVFFRRTCHRKNEKCGDNAAKTYFLVYNSLSGARFLRASVF